MFANMNSVVHLRKQVSQTEPYGRVTKLTLHPNHQHTEGETEGFFFLRGGGALRWTKEEVENIANDFSKLIVVSSVIRCP